MKRGARGAPQKLVFFRALLSRDFSRLPKWRPSRRLVWKKRKLFTIACLIAGGFSTSSGTDSHHTMSNNHGLVQLNRLLYHGWNNLNTWLIKEITLKGAVSRNLSKFKQREMPRNWVKNQLLSVAPPVFKWAISPTLISVDEFNRNSNSTNCHRP